MSAGAVAALALLAGVGGSCANYNQDRSATGSIWDVRVTTSSAAVGGCRLIGGVDSRDSAKGCGLTVQPTPEECLRYQVRRAGGDTLLMNGPIGQAYDCSGHPAASAESAPVPPPTAPQPQPREESRATPAPAPAAPAPPPPPTAVPPESPVRIARDRAMARGCVYLGDVDSPSACADENGEATGVCADQARRAGGNLILRDGDRAQIFSCRAKP